MGKTGRTYHIPNSRRLSCVAPWEKDRLVERSSAMGCGRISVAGHLPVRTTGPVGKFADWGKDEELATFRILDDSQWPRGEGCPNPALNCHVAGHHFSR